MTQVTTASGADVKDRYEARTYTDADGGKLPYRLLKPAGYDGEKSYPLVIFFHGAGERGTDNVKQLVHGMSDFASDDVMKAHPAFVIAPQCPTGDQWVDVPWSADSHTMPKSPTTPMRQSFELIDALRKEFSIDENRIYVTGLSMGGFGAWDAVQRRPKQFAAALPICGGGDAALAKSIAHVPIWVFHGDKDGAVKVSRSRDMVNALKKAKGQPRYTEYPGVGHNSWAATYANRKIYDWLFAQRRK